jgi:uncharacterized membrane protein YbaN (DUF454 family)
VKKLFFFVLGWICLVMAYIGLVTPGIPFSIFLVGAAYCFSKSSERMHKWLYNHKHFGPFLTNWGEKRIFPQRGKYAMILVMASSLLIMWFTVPLKGVIYTAITMALVAVWAWRFPSTVEEYERRIATGKNVGWFNNSF